MTDQTDLSQDYHFPEWTAMIGSEDMPRILATYREWWNEESPHASESLRAEACIVNAIVTRPEHVGLLVGVVAGFYRERE